jgi:hypothetical protein
VLAVPHRLSSIREADKDIVLEQRHVVVRGCLAELKALDGFYAELWRLHASEPSPREKACESRPAAAVGSRHRHGQRRSCQNPPPRKTPPHLQGMAGTQVVSFPC